MGASAILAELRFNAKTHEAPDDGCAVTIPSMIRQLRNLQDL